MDVYPELLSQPLPLGLNLFKQGAADIARPDQADRESLLGEEETRVELPLSRLPEGSHEGSWLKISFIGQDSPDQANDGSLENASFELDLAGEQEQRERMARLLEKIKGKNKA